MFSPSVELVVERVRRERRWLGRCPDGEIFLVVMLIHHSATWWTSSGHVAMAGA